LVLDPEESRFSIDRGDLSVDLRYRPMDSPWIPRGDGILLRKGKRALRWVVPVPRARLSGSVRAGDIQTNLDGHGYSDFVQTDIPPWRLPLRELLWGRALSDNTLVVWNRVGFKNGKGTRHVCLGLIRQDNDERTAADSIEPNFSCWTDHPDTKDRYPAVLGLDLNRPEQKPAHIVLDETRLLLGDFVPDVQKFSSRFERWMYRKFTGNPVEYKLLSKMRNGSEGHRALAAHEWIRWGWGRSAGRTE
jgi:hypothetical protein